MAYTDPLADLKTRCESCKVCKKLSAEVTLCHYGKPSFGYGKTLGRPLMFIGEAPGEAGCGITGIPFTNDKSGILYNWILEKYGKTMQDVYTTNIVKCCPFGNRTPTKEETRESRDAET